MKKLMVLLPCLEGAGGISVLRNLLGVLKKKDYEITVISQLEGQMRSSFESMGISVQIESNMLEEAFLSKVTEADEIFVNTLQMIPVVQKLNGCKIKVYWWIHEPPAYFKVCRELIPQGFFAQLKENINVYAAGQFVHDYIWSAYGYDAEVLNFGVEDVLLKIEKEIQTEKGIQAEKKNGATDGRIRFLLPSFYFDYLKGQDLLLKAITALPQEFLNRSEFFFLGHVEEDMQGLYGVIQKLEQAWGNVHYLPPMEHEQMLEWMNEMDCLVAPSREDATNACIVEGMMLSKLCICSDMTGVSRYLEDCVSALVFPAGNVEELLKRLMLVISNFDDMAVIGENGRKVYEAVFSQEVFERRVGEIFWGSRAS